MTRTPRLLLAAAGLTLIAAVSTGCTPKSAKGADLKGQAFTDNFDRKELGAKYKKVGGTWDIVDGKLHSSGEKNIPLWLDVPLGKNVVVEFTAMSKSPAVDTKVEIFGDGERHESGYIVIFGGWNNRISTIARLDEHEKTRVEKRTKWEKDRVYRWRVERRNGKDVRWFIDDKEVLVYEDRQPLVGKRQNFLGFTNWQSDVYYDDLKITPLPD